MIIKDGQEPQGLVLKHKNVLKIAITITVLLLVLVAYWGFKQLLTGVLPVGPGPGAQGQHHIYKVS